jgi:PAS domain S-box-containing protein
MDSLFQALTRAADGAFVINEDQRIVFWNRAAQEMLGYAPEEVIGQACYEILGGQGDEGQRICHHHCHVSTMAVTGSPVTSYDTYARTKTGQMRWLSVSILTIFASDDATPLVVHLFRDATQKKQNEQFAHQILNATAFLRGGVAQPPGTPGSAKSPTAVTELTNREREVLSLLVQGFSTRDIAQSLSISPSTARNHIQNILNKLQVHSRLEAVAYAFEHGLVGRD